MEEKNSPCETVGDGRGAWECDGKGAEGMDVEEEALVAVELTDETLEAEVWKADVRVEEVAMAGYGGLWDDRRSIVILGEVI